MAELATTPQPQRSPWVDEPVEVEPLNPRFEALCRWCHLVYPKAIGCECEEWAPSAPVVELAVMAA